MPRLLIHDPFARLWRRCRRNRGGPATFVALYMLAFLVLAVFITALFEVIGRRLAD